MKFLIIPVTPLQQNCTLLWCEKTLRGAAVDAGGDTERIVAAAREHGVTLEKLLLTHGHLDHAAAAGALAEQLGISIEGPHLADRVLLQNIPKQCAAYGFPPAAAFEPQRWLQQGDTVSVGEETLEVRHCPGHTPGHVVYFHAASAIAIVGDVLFKGSIGRSDLPGGDYDTLIRSIREQLWPLGNDVRFIPGHGPLSSIGEERRSNPFVGDRVLG
jgi:hydroxyacylglutathione hydrolase